MAVYRRLVKPPKTAHGDRIGGTRAIGADPAEGAKAHLELATRYLEEAEKLEDPVQASEKAYKAFEEAVKAAAI